MNINAGFETPEELEAKQDALAGEIETGLKEVDQLAVESERLGELIARISTEGLFCRGYAAEADVLTSGQFGQKLNMGYFTSVPSKTYYQPAMEGLLSSLGEGLKKGIKILGELIMKLVNWVKSFFTKDKAKETEATVEAAEAAQEAAHNAGMDKAENMADFVASMMQDINEMQADFDKKSKEIDEQLSKNDTQLKDLEKKKDSGEMSAAAKADFDEHMAGIRQAADKLFGKKADLEKELATALDNHDTAKKAVNAALQDLGGMELSEVSGFKSLVKLRGIADRDKVLFHLATNKKVYEGFYAILTFMASEKFKKQSELFTTAVSAFEKMVNSWAHDHGESSDPMTVDSLAAFSAAYREYRRTGDFEGQGTAYKLNDTVMKSIKLGAKFETGHQSEMHKDVEKIKELFTELEVSLTADLPAASPQDELKTFNELWRAAVRFRVNDLSPSLRKIVDDESIRKQIEYIKETFEKIERQIEATKGGEESRHQDVISMIRAFAQSSSSVFQMQYRITRIANRFLTGLYNFHHEVSLIADTICKTEDSAKFRKEMDAIRARVNTMNW